MHAADTVNISVSGNLTRPPCVLTSGTSLTINFGDVRTDQIAVSEYRWVTLHMTCAANSSVDISFNANNGTQSPTVARTTADNLGVSLFWPDETAANLTGSPRRYNGLSGTVDLSLKARLQAFGALSPGSFNSSFVMTINYL